MGSWRQSTSRPLIHPLKLSSTREAFKASLIGPDPLSKEVFREVALRISMTILSMVCWVLLTESSILRAQLTSLACSQVQNGPVSRMWLQKTPAKLQSAWLRKKRKVSSRVSSTSSRLMVLRTMQDPATAWRSSKARRVGCPRSLTSRWVAVTAAASTVAVARRSPNPAPPSPSPNPALHSKKVPPRSPSPKWAVRSKALRKGVNPFQGISTKAGLHGNPRCPESLLLS